VALYRVVLLHEAFEDAAHALSRLLRPAQEAKPGQRRMLFLDIEGHRQADGRCDADTYELQYDFLRFHPAPPPTDIEVARLVATIRRRVLRLLRRRRVFAETNRRRRFAAIVRPAFFGACRVSAHAGNGAGAGERRSTRAVSSRVIRRSGARRATRQNCP
jgi:hypothetical protein